MAATPDRSIGFFSAVYSRLRASACRRLHQGQEAATARRSGAPLPRRFGRNLAFVSFNLEVSISQLRCSRIPSNSPSQLYLCSHVTY